MKTTLHDPLSRLTLLIFRAQQAFSADGDRLTASWNLTAAKWKVLGAVALAETAPSAAAIGRAMGLTRQAAIKQASLLREQGLLAQQADPKDARAPVYLLTAAGHTAYAAISAAWAERAAGLSAGLPGTAFDAANGLLEDLLARLEAVPLTTISRVKRKIP